ncbi:MAG: rhodanese-like domain-containing protein [Wenzhouxiangella sp.]
MRFKFLITLALTAALFGSTVALAGEIQGRIMEISRIANTIQINVPGQDPVVVRFDDNTRFIEADGIGDLAGSDLIKVTFEPGQPASAIQKVIFGLPEGMEISTEELLAILTGEAPYTLIDTRPRGRFVEATIPSSVNAYPGLDEFTSMIETLAPNKTDLVVFYCGGPTCPYTGQAIAKAQAAGFTNIKGYQAGVPAWRRAQLPMHADPVWLSERLNPGHVIIDTRNQVIANRAHIPTAVTMPAANFEALTETFIAEGREARMPGASDRRAPIILYSNGHNDQDVLVAYRELASWGYRNIAVLRDGLDGWEEAGLPVESRSLALAINFVRQLPPGAIAPEAFVGMRFPNDSVQLVDVRADDEVAAGIIPGAIHMPLDRLEAMLGNLDKAKPVIVHCATGVRAEMAYRTLLAAGYDVQYVNVEMEVAGDGSFRIL